MFERLLPADVVVVSADAETAAGALYPAEEAHLARAGEKRRREFTLGRNCAREALRRLGAPAGEIPVGRDRGPVWPPGVVGSITHCDGLAAAAVAWRTDLLGLGIDAEPHGDLEESLVHLICTRRESDRIRRMPPPAAVTGWSKVIFSAKEAVHKAVAPLSGVTMSFHDVEVDFAPANDFSVRYVGAGHASLPDISRLQGRYTIDSGLVLTAVVLRSAARPRA